MRVEHGNKYISLVTPTRRLTIQFRPITQNKISQCQPDVHDLRGYQINKNVPRCGPAFRVE
jgi:hypothetical protein